MRLLGYLSSTFFFAGGVLLIGAALLPENFGLHWHPAITLASGVFVATLAARGLLANLPKEGEL